MRDAEIISPCTVSGYHGNTDWSHPVGDVCVLQLPSDNLHVSVLHYPFQGFTSLSLPFNSISHKGHLNIDCLGAILHFLALALHKYNS